jgi:c-di-GMP-binding flagellar brake protein YcgR
MQIRYAGVEKRRHERLATNFLIVFKVREPWDVLKRIGNRELVAIMFDLSEGGMGILTNHDIPLATTLLSRFTLVNPYMDGDSRVRTMEIIGDVSYNVPLPKGEHRLGVCFTQIAHEDRNALDGFITMSLNHERIEGGPEDKAQGQFEK